jgi:hypothetical protein
MPWPYGGLPRKLQLFCLDTGRRVTRKQFREIPMPASVVQRVAAFSLRDKHAGELVFTNRNGNIFADDTENKISGAVANANEDASAGVDISEHESSPHDEPPGIIMETEPNNPGTNLGPTMGAQLGVTAGVPQGGNIQDGAITGVPEGTHSEIPGVSGPPGGDIGIPGVPDGGTHNEIPGVPDSGTHNEIPGVPDGIAAGAPEGDAAVPDDTTSGVPEGDPPNLTDTEEDGTTMIDNEDSSTSQPENDSTGVIEDISNSGD